VRAVPVWKKKEVEYPGQFVLDYQEGINLLEKKSPTSLAITYHRSKPE
jgi:hypothetical protein